ncbi:UDP-N-acetylglucosamine pyrophosphorylase [Boothiomyces sp. JEL0866]|nr:UDP-N-acetylglucosamine pyrophosphorylase [Boothiomyces sp. JEL0866]
MSSFEQVKQKLSEHGQGHLLDFYDSLDTEKKQALINNVKDLNLARINQIFKTATSAKPTSKNVSPLPKDAFDSTLYDAQKTKSWYDKGLSLIAQNKVAVILLAGGQGTRLGSSDPKGCYNIQLPSGKSLFQLQGERILKVQQLAQKLTAEKVVIPWYVMTSGPTRAATEAFFISKNYFGLDKSNVFFFNQGVLPAFTFEGKIFLESKESPAFSPDGNGGIYAALKSEGVIADLEKRNIPYIHAYCVDNCLVKVPDPVFIGYCVAKNADCGAKSIPKKNPDEAVGVICLRDGKPSVVEYSEIDPEMSRSRDASGALIYNAANIANHFYTTEFLKKIEKFEHLLEYHIAKKKIKHINAEGVEIKPESSNGIKLELFIFDVFPFTERFAVLECARKDEFSPLKNAPGSNDGDSPDTSRADIMAQHVRFVEAAGGKVVSEDGSAPVFEISPLVSFAGEGLEAVKGKTYKSPKHKPAIKPSLSWWIDFGSEPIKEEEYDPIEAAKQERQKQALARLERQKTHSEIVSKTITRVSNIVKQKQDAIKTLIEKERDSAENEIGLTKSLSSEDLQLNQLPADRNYQVYPNEKYHIHQQYISNQIHTPLKKTRKELEKDLRTFYRVGHVEELKRQEFGKQLQETRKYYMKMEKEAIKKEKKNIVFLKAIELPLTTGVTVYGYPTFIFFQNGKAVEKVTGAKIDVVEEIVDKYSKGFQKEETYLSSLWKTYGF